MRLRFPDGGARARRGRCPPCPACRSCPCGATASAGTERRRCRRPGAAGAACKSTEPGAPAQGGTREWREFAPGANCCNYYYNSPRVFP
eukprot:4205395-Pyramimonas_sp.AAC.1